MLTPSSFHPLAFSVRGRRAPSRCIYVNGVSPVVRKIKRLSTRRIATISTPGRYADGAGLELQVSSSGTKSWLFRYTLRGREHRMGIGPLHVVCLAEARERARQARLLILDGKDPLLEKRKRNVAASDIITFRECADAFLKSKLMAFRSEKHRDQWRSTLEVAHTHSGRRQYRGRRYEPRTTRPEAAVGRYARDCLPACGVAWSVSSPSLSRLVGARMRATLAGGVVT